MGTLDQTKTSGPRKRIHFLPVFVSSRVFFMKPDWLDVGWSIWTSADMCFERDYFLPWQKMQMRLVQFRACQIIPALWPDRSMFCGF